MSFRLYVKKHGSEDAKELLKLKRFPKEADWRLLKIFVNSYTIPQETITELEELHDNYHCDKVVHLFE